MLFDQQQTRNHSPPCDSRSVLEENLMKKAKHSLHKHSVYRTFLPHSKQSNMIKPIEDYCTTKLLKLSQVAFNNKTQTNRVGVTEDCCFALSTDYKGLLATTDGQFNIHFFDYDGNYLKQLKTNHKEIITQVCFLKQHHNKLLNSSSSTINHYHHTKPKEEEEKDEQLLENRARENYDKMKEEKSENDDLLEQALMQSLKKKEEHELLGNTEEQIFYTSSLDKTIKIWNGENNIETLKDHKDWIRCLDISSDNSTLISGCISGRIFGWDCLNSHKIKFQISNDPPTIANGLNTINSLNFCNLDNNVLVSGSRDGYIRMYDIRSNSTLNDNCLKPIIKMKTHEGKLNQIVFTSDDRYMLSSGRDNYIRLLDRRKLPCNVTDDLNYIKPLTLQTYNKHKCLSYNVNCTFFSNENYVMTGSEDNKIYIYETFSGKLVNVLEGHESVVHLLLNLNERDIISNSIESSRIFFWRPSTEDVKISLENEVENTLERSILEELMRTHGDSLLNLYHTNSLNGGDDSGLSGLGDSITVTPENEGVFRDITRTFIELLVQNQQQVLNQYGIQVEPQDDDDSSDEEQVD
ncbi:hypothetical protein ABK040_011481 [Willaertia magna]